MTSSPVENTQRINLSWLLTLRWGAAVGQIVIILAIDRLVGIDLPLIPLAAIVALELASNAAATWWMRHTPDVRTWAVGLLMMADVLLLTALLYLTGGPFNPFSFLYLVNVALAAVVLPPRWSWGLTVLSLAAFGLLFLAHVPLALDEPFHHGGHMWGHLQGMWVAFGVAAGFIVYFIQRVTRALAQRDAELAAARGLAARHERLASLATLAAGATHELATPLSTIAVVAKELERRLTHDALVADARLIRDQVERCRETLVQMAADAGESSGETAVPVPVETLLRRAVGELPPARVEVTVAPEARGRIVRVPPRAVERAIHAVLKNAVQASPAAVPVAAHARPDGERVVLEIADRGAGMSPEVLEHAGEPFFTTRAGEGDRGMGLGLFLARVVLEKVGGGLELDSALGRGTRVTLILPAAARAAEPAPVAAAVAAPAVAKAS
jgi:two-component system sensor histidine kinase RegB